MNSNGSSLLATAELSQLVIVDIQSRLAGAMPEVDSFRVVRNAGILARAAGLLSIPVTATEQYPNGLGHTEPTLRNMLPDGTAIIEKTCFACTGEAAFRDQLTAHQRPQVILAGMEAHVCVLQTALELYTAGYQVFVMDDGVCSRNPAHYRNAMKRLRRAGVVVSNTESVVFEWLRDARHEHFKTISALIK